MECRQFEDGLTDYMDRSLPTADLTAMAEHLHECRSCAGLLEDVRSVLVACRTFPDMDVDLALLERVLLRTSGRPRTRSLREIMEQLLRPVLTPRFAVGAVLATLFLTFAFNLMIPRISVVAAALSPRELFRTVDRSVQQLYSGGLRLYDKKNEWQAEINFFKNNMFNKLGFVIEQMDVPVEGKQKPGKSGQQQEKAPSEKSSLLLLPA